MTLAGAVSPSRRAKGEIPRASYKKGWAGEISQKKGEEKHPQVIRRGMQQWSVTFLGAVSSLKTHAQKLSAIRRQKKRLGMVPTLKSIITKFKLIEAAADTGKKTG